MTYEEARTIKNIKGQAVDAASKNLQKYPKGAMGLTPDSVKFSKEFQADKKIFNVLNADAKKFTQFFMKKFKKEYAADRLQIRLARANLILKNAN